MSGEARAIDRTTEGPVTLERLRRDLANLGVREGDILLVHASLSSLGFVPGGAQTVVEALLGAVGSSGLVAAPTFTSHLSDPRHWTSPPVPPEWRQAIRLGGSAFDPERTASRGVGVLPEQLRTTPGARRGDHPHHSFAAIGAGADDLVAPHPVEAWLGEASPLGRLYAVDARVLFLGTGYATCTAFHLAEHRAARLRTRQDGVPMLVDGIAQWVAFDAPDYDTAGYEAIGAAFEVEEPVAWGVVGWA
jgi:aminoglycoside 3-N-acetyltransferase